MARVTCATPFALLRNSCEKLQIRAQISFGLKCKSPKKKEKNSAERERRPLLCGFGGEASPKDGDTGSGGYIGFEQEIHA